MTGGCCDLIVEYGMIVEPVKWLQMKRCWKNQKTV
jgi:hypothetical protein